MFSRTYYPSTAGSVIVPASAGVYPSGYAGSGYGVPAYSGSYYGGYGGYGGYQQAPMVINGSRSSRGSSVIVSQPMALPPVPHTAMPLGYGGYHAPAMPYYGGSAAPTVIMTGGSSSGSSRRHRRHSHSHSHHHRSRSHSRSRFFDF